MRAANGAAGLPIVVVGRIDIGGAVEVEVVGVAGARVWSRGPVVAIVAGVGEQVAILVDEAAPNLIKINIQGSAKYTGFCKKLLGLFVAVATKKRTSLKFCYLSFRELHDLQKEVFA